MNKREWMLAGALAAIRSGRDFDDAELVTRLAELYDLIPADSDDGGWIAHGGQPPYPEGTVDVTYRNGDVIRSWDADDFVWSHEGLYPNEEIVKWRPARD